MTQKSTVFIYFTPEACSRGFFIVCLSTYRFSMTENFLHRRGPNCTITNFTFSYIQKWQLYNDLCNSHSTLPTAVTTWGWASRSVPVWWLEAEYEQLLILVCEGLMRAQCSGTIEQRQHRVHIQFKTAQCSGTIQKSTVFRYNSNSTVFRYNWTKTAQSSNTIQNSTVFRYNSNSRLFRYNSKQHSVQVQFKRAQC